MNQDWKNYLSESNAPCSAETTLNESWITAKATAHDSTVLCDLSHFDTVVVAGNDAVNFMQGQFTNDVNLVDEQHSQISAFCNQKGRMLANFRLFKYQANHFICINHTLTESCIQHLQRYVLSAQVAIQDISPQLIHFGISGNNAAALLAPYIDTLNDEIDSVSSNEDYIFIRVAGIRPRYEIFCDLEKAKALWQTLSRDASIVDGHYWDYLNIENGLPFIDKHTVEAFVPLMANMELINGVSFTKGCYTGQEIVARTHYLGKQKRRTYRLKIKTGDIPLPGQELTTASAGENQYTGTLVSVYPTAENEYEALAVIQIKSTEEALSLKGMDASISLLALPYSLDEAPA